MRLYYHPSLVAEKSPFVDPEDSEQKQYVSELNLSLKETVPAVYENR